MMLEPIAPIGAPISLEPAAMGEAQNETPTVGFGNWFAKEIGEANDKLIDAHLEAQKVAAGSNENLHEVMMHLQEARMSFEMLAQVRNRLLESYQEVMRMQV